MLAYWTTTFVKYFTKNCTTFKFLTFAMKDQIIAKAGSGIVSLVAPASPKLIIVEIVKRTRLQARNQVLLRELEPKLFFLKT